MFIQATDKWKKSVLINIQAISHIELESKIKLVNPEGKDFKYITGVTIHLSTSYGDSGNIHLISFEFIDEQAEKLRRKLPQILNAHTF